MSDTTDKAELRLRHANPNNSPDFQHDVRLDFFAAS